MSLSELPGGSGLLSRNILKNPARHSVCKVDGLCLAKDLLSVNDYLS